MPFEAIINTHLELSLDYGCALQKEILVQGRIYISEHHICFNANIFGWVTNLVLAFSEVVSIEKKMTAMFIPNGIQICTLHAKHSFASFLSRDMAYDQMFDVWRVAHPSNPLSSTLKAQVGETISDNDDDSLVDADDSSYTGSEESDDDDEYPRTEPSQVDALGIARKSSPTESDKSVEPSEEELARRRALSDVGPRPNMIAVAAANKATPSLSVPPMTVLPKTECQCAHSGGHGHYPNVALDATFPGSIAALYNLLFNSSFIADFLKDGEKSQDINIGDWIKESDSKESVRKSTYIKYLGMAIGPKSTKCHLEERCLSCDLNKNVTVLTTTQTPDVPMGTSFSVKTRACITSAGGGKVQLLVTFQVEFTKGGLLKSTIEKASSDGQITYYKNLEAAIKSYISTHPSEFGQMRKKRRDKKSGKIRKSRSETDKDTQAIELKKSLNRPENESQASVYRVVEDIISGMATTSANILRFIIKHVGIPSSAQITFFFFGLLVFTNVFLLRKMSIVDKQLADLSYSRLHSVEGGMTVVNLEQEREMLWNWLKSRDQGKSKLKTSLEKQWNAQTQQTLRQKALLDQQLVGIQAIIRSTEEQLDTMRSSSYKKHQ
ncbi:hypothetical protein NQZ79_g7466 [Umbelopsis isabellina]|nr:hypothetical protein NQZ79_g7466 [Umbelopsis isabellina]